MIDISKCHTNVRIIYGRLIENKLSDPSIDKSNSEKFCNDCAEEAYNTYYGIKKEEPPQIQEQFIPKKLKHKITESKGEGDNGSIT